MTIVISKYMWAKGIILVSIKLLLNDGNIYIKVGGGALLRLQIFNHVTVFLHKLKIKTCKIKWFQ